MKLDRYAPIALGLIVVALILVTLGIAAHEMLSQVTDFLNSLPKGQ